MRVLLAAALSLAGFGAVGFAVLGMLEGGEAAGRRLVELSPGWMGLALLVWSLSFVAQELRLRALVPVHPRPPAAGFVWVVMGSNAVHLALPGPVAELGAAWALRQQYGVPMPAALAAALLARVLALAVFGVVALALWPIVADDLPSRVAAAVTPLAVGTGLLSAAIFGFLRWPLHGVRVAGALIARLSQWPLIGRMLQRIAPRIRWWARCFAAVGRVPIRSWLEAGLFSLVNLLVLTLSAGLTLRAAGIDSSFLGMLFIQATTAVVSVAGLLVPGGLGAVEMLFVLLFPLCADGGAADAVFAAIALRCVHLTNLLLGVPALSWLVATLPGEPARAAITLADALDAEIDAELAS